MSRLDDMKRLADTVRHLEPAQGYHRARLRTQKALLERAPAAFERRWAQPVPTAAHWPSGFDPIDLVDPPPAGAIGEVAAGRFTLVGEHHDVAERGWRPEDRSQLFRYHLHYFEWAWSLAAFGSDEAPEAFATLWRSWRDDAAFGRWDEWSPYVVSLRTWVLCGVFERLVRGTDIESDVRDQIGLHAGFLRHNLELDVGGNHLIKNLKALIGLGVFCDDPELIDIALAHLPGQLDRQVLADGGHFERSPAYHCQVLGDLLDLRGLMSAAGVDELPGLDDAIERMRRWLGTMLMPNGDIPLFGDSGPIAPTRLKVLGPTPRPQQRVVHLEDSGYVVCRPDDRWHVVCDVGAPCPPELPAHAQAGCLSFVASLDGEPVVVDTGTTTYVGKRRSYERSTAAHNTIEIDDVDQTEVWGSFRAGRRAQPTVHEVADDSPIVVDASHDGYEHLAGAPVHRRRFEIGPDGIVLRDRIEGSGFHRAMSRVFLAPGIDAELTEDGIGDDAQTDRLLFAATRDGEAVPVHVVYASVSTGFGSRTACRSLWWEVWDHLPIEIVTRISAAPVEKDQS